MDRHHQFINKKGSISSSWRFKENLSVAEDVDPYECISQLGDIILDKRIHTLYQREPHTLKRQYRKERWSGIK